MKQTQIPKNAKRIPLRPLAWGEITGHNHRLIAESGLAVEDVCELYEVKDGDVSQHFLRVTAEGVSLIHAEEGSLQTADHHPQVIAPGEYRVVIQQEATDWGTRNVAD